MYKVISAPGLGCIERDITYFCLNNRAPRSVVGWSGPRLQTCQFYCADVQKLWKSTNPIPGFWVDEKVDIPTVWHISMLGHFCLRYHLEIVVICPVNLHFRLIEVDQWSIDTSMCQPILMHHMIGIDQHRSRLINMIEVSINHRLTLINFDEPAMLIVLALCP